MSLREVIESVRETFSRADRERVDRGELPLALQPEGRPTHATPEMVDALRAAGRRYPDIDADGRILRWRTPGTSVADRERAEWEERNDRTRRYTWFDQKWGDV